MNVVDPSGWLEYFADGPGAGFFAGAIEDADALIVPTISLYEVFKRILQQRDESAALSAVALMQQGAIVDLTAPVALSAAARCPHEGQLSGSHRTARDTRATRSSLYSSREP